MGEFTNSGRIYDFIRYMICFQELTSAIMNNLESCAAKLTLTEKVTSWMDLMWCEITPTDLPETGGSCIDTEYKTSLRKPDWGKGKTAISANIGYLYWIFSQGLRWGGEPAVNLLSPGVGLHLLARNRRMSASTGGKLFFYVIGSIKKNFTNKSDAKMPQTSVSYEKKLKKSTATTIWLGQ